MSSSNNEYYLYFMRKLIFSIFYMISSFVFSQSNNAPVATDVYTSTKKNTSVLIHLVGSDIDITDNLTYTIVSVSSHGTIKDPMTDAVLSSGSTLSGNGNMVKFVLSSVNKYDSYIESGITSFKYKVNDGTIDSAEKTVNIKVYTDFLASPSLLGTEIIGDSDGDNFGQSIAMKRRSNGSWSSIVWFR